MKHRDKKLAVPSSSLCPGSERSRKPLTTKPLRSVSTRAQQKSTELKSQAKAVPTKVKEDKRKITEKTAPDVLKSLHMEHERINQLLDDMIQPDAIKAKLIKKNLAEFTALTMAHFRFEERHVYSKISDDHQDIVFACLEEHSNMKLLLKRIMVVGTTNVTFHAKLRVFKNLFQQHVKEEEGTIFPILQRGLGEVGLRNIGITYTQSKAA